MAAIDTPPPATKKFSIFRRFSRKQDERQVAVNNDEVYNAVLQGPSRLRKPSIDSNSSPPLSPASSRSRNDSLLDVRRSPSPHLTKDKTYRKDRTVRFTERADIPQVVRERLQRGTSASSKSSTSSTSSSRVQANALVTQPFPSTPHSRVHVSIWDLFLPPSQVHALYMGYLPKEMSDKWFIYSEGPDQMGKLKVHFHRSWTGAKMAELFVVMDVKGEGAGKVVGLKWNAGNDVGSGRMRAEEAKYLIRTTVKCVLGFGLEDGN